MNKQGRFLGIPYDWRAFTWKGVKSRTWNKNDHNLFIPKSFGWGYDINFYELVHHRRKVLTGIIVIVALVGLVVIKHAIYVDKAHQTFETYYAFRGCSKLVKKTDTYGLCKLPNGQTIRLVKFHGLWYLDGDLPYCIGNVCL